MGEKDRDWEHGTMWIDRVKWGPTVEHRGHWFPREFEAGFERRDGLIVELLVMMDERRGALPMSVTIRSEHGVSGRDAQQPVMKLAQRAARHVAERVDPPEWHLPSEQRRPELSEVKVGELPPRRAAPLERVAALYKDAIADGRPVFEPVVEELGVGRDRAYQLIHEARKKGLLPPTKQGRKHA